MNNRNNYTVKILENGKEVRKVQTHLLRRFTNELRMINWTESTLAYLRVSYGKALDIQGVYSIFYNDCWCSSNENLLEMFEYFRYETI